MNLGSIFAEAITEAIKTGKGQVVPPTAAGILDAIKFMDAKMGEEIEQKEAEAEALSAELTVLVESGQLQTYSFLELYDVLQNSALVAMPLGCTALNVTLKGKELVDNHDDIIPAFRDLLMDKFVLVKDYEYLKSQQVKKKDLGKLASAQEALQALAQGKKVRVEYTNSDDEMVSIVLERYDDRAVAVGVPMEALLNGVFYIV